MKFTQINNIMHWIPFFFHMQKHSNEKAREKRNVFDKVNLPIVQHRHSHLNKRIWIARILSRNVLASFSCSLYFFAVVWCLDEEPEK